MALIRVDKAGAGVNNEFTFIIGDIETGNNNYGVLDLSYEQLSGFTQITVTKERGEGPEYAHEYYTVASNGTLSAATQITTGTAFNIPSISQGEFVHIYYRMSHTTTGNSNEYKVTLS